MKLAVSILAMSALLLTGCGSSKSSNNSNPAGVGQNNQPMQLVPIQYAAAIVFEGGMGMDMWNYKDIKPLWRLYICAPSSSAVQEGQIHIDIEKLGQPKALSKLTYTDTGVVRYVGFTSFDLKYSIKGFLLNYPEMPHGYAWGEADGEFSGRFNYDTNEVSEQFKHEFSRGSLVSVTSRVYDTTIENQKTYIRSWLQRFTAAQSENRLSPITPCEKANKPYVFEVGDQITQ